MSDFDDIRPYRDSEVRPTLERLLRDPELADAVARLRFPRLPRWLIPLLRLPVRRAMARQCAGLDSVRDFQKLVEHYMLQMMDSTGTRLSVSGLDSLDPQTPYLFISNHRDIAMDPAFVNIALYRASFNTLRIAIGDNLLTKPWVSDLMRLNKSFIVNRSAKKPREKLLAARKLSAYIHHSLVEEGANIWIAQREGRAKDGCDKTNPAVVGMLTLNRPKAMDFAGYVRCLHIVPVAISYELDPCDAAKAREVYQLRTRGEYLKETHEDVHSIARGIDGRKGQVHVAFGEPLTADYPDSEAVAEEIDRQILGNYVLHATNCFAYQMLHGTAPKVNYGPAAVPFEAGSLEQQRREFELRIAAIPSEYRQTALEAYANPVSAKLRSG